jgi:hypothetical protein
MSWELYEVWTVDSDGYEQILDTTNSIKEARKLAQSALTDDVVSVIIYKETEDGDQEFIEEISGR